MTERSIRVGVLGAGAAGGAGAGSAAAAQLTITGLDKPLPMTWQLDK